MHKFEKRIIGIEQQRPSDQVRREIEELAWESIVDLHMSVGDPEITDETVLVPYNPWGDPIRMKDKDKLLTKE